MDTPHSETKQVSYKYASELATHPGCPADASAAFSEKSCHGILGDFKDFRNFVPKAKSDPDRFTNKPSKICCKAWGLSMFETPEQLKNRIEQISKTSRKARIVIGDKCAVLKLTSEHGRRTPTESSGHFTFYEFSRFIPELALVEVVELFP